LAEFHKIAAYPSSIEKNLTTSIHIDNDLPTIDADQEKLTHVVYNLIENAFNYTRPNDSITVNLSLQTDERHVLLTVADTGVGIPEHFQHAVWQRFERYEDHALELNVTGTGLGLSLVRDLVTLHHGNVWFESELNQGTTFYVELPIAHPSAITNRLDRSQIDTGD
jgi:two-component system sensor histidine kinase VicK